MSINNKELVRGAYKEFNKKNSTILNDDATKDLVYHSVAAGQLQGREAVKEFWENLFTGYPDIHVTIIDLMAEGEMCSIRGRFEGTNTGALFDHPVTGKKVNFEYMELFRFSDGKVVEGWQFYNPVTVMQQLGLMPVTS